MWWMWFVVVVVTYYNRAHINPETSHVRLIRRYSIISVTTHCSIKAVPLYSSGEMLVLLTEASARCDASLNWHGYWRGKQELTRGKCPESAINNSSKLRRDDEQLNISRPWKTLFQIRDIGLFRIPIYNINDPKFQYFLSSREMAIF